jgi:hypothetical protein
MGSTSRIDFEFPAGWMVDEMCINGECQNPIDPSQRVPPQETPRLSWKVDDDPASYTYRLNATSPDGSPVVREGVVETEEFRANGPGCDPVTANATLLLDDTGVVTIRHP